MVGQRCLFLNVELFRAVLGEFSWWNFRWIELANWIDGDTWTGGNVPTFRPHSGRWFIEYGSSYSGTESIVVLERRIAHGYGQYWRETNDNCSAGRGCVNSFNCDYNSRVVRLMVDISNNVSLLFIFLFSKLKSGSPGAWPHSSKRKR